MRRNQRGIALITVLLVMSLALLITAGMLRSHRLALNSSAQQIQGCFLQLVSQFFGNHGTASQGSNIIHHGFSSVAESGSLDSHAFEGASKLVQDKSSQRFPFHIFTDDQQFSSLLDDLL